MALKLIPVASMLALLAPLCVQASKGLDLLHAEVRSACECAEQRVTGVDAAIQCNDFTQAYARRTVELRARWDADDRRVEERLRGLLEHCLAQAKGYRQSLDELGLLGEGQGKGQGKGLGGGIALPSPTPSWYRSSVAELSAQRGQLVRIRTRAGESVTGMLRESDGVSVRLKLAERDGGGERAIASAEVADVRVLNLP